MVRLGDVADVRLGRQRSPANHRGSNMRPYLRAANVGWEGLKLDDIKEMNFSEAELASYRLEAGDLLLSEASGSISEVGKPAIWEGQIEHCAFQNTLIRVRSRAHEPRYLLHYFRWLAASGRTASMSRGVGIFHLGQAAVADAIVPLPPIDEQRRIAAILDLASAHQLRCEAMLAAHDELARVYFDVQTAAVHGGARVQLGDVAEVGGGLQLSGARAKHPEVVDYLRVANVYRGALDLREIKQLRATPAELVRTQLRPGDLLVVEGHGNVAEVGRCSLWPGSAEPMVHQNHLIRVRPDTGILVPEFAEFLINGPIGRGHFRRTANTTSGLNTISTATVRSMRLTLPTLDEQLAIVDRLRRIAGSKGWATERASGARALALSLQQRAFSGEL